MTDRVYGYHEADAMYSSIENALAVLGQAGSTSAGFLRELKRERELLLEHRLALSRLLDAVRMEQGRDRPGWIAEISPRLYAAMQQAEKALD